MKSKLKNKAKKKICKIMILKTLKKISNNK